jgi:hypothetical protein
MIDALPVVDVNLFVRNGEATIAQAIESVLAQTWPAIRLTVLDNASTDTTCEIVRGYQRDLPSLGLVESRADLGLMLNCMRAFAHGDADFVMPKTADDVLAPEFVERAMAVLLAHPDCAMCHAAAAVFTGGGTVCEVYPPAHWLHAVDPDPLARSHHVMTRYTSAPSFWGVFRRDAVARLARPGFAAGWDHALLAELALYGEIRHVPEPLYWRRDGGKPVARIARAAAEAAQRGLAIDDGLADLRWMTPLITTAHAHVERFAVTRLPAWQRVLLMEDAPGIFRGRWGPLLRCEANEFLAARPALEAEASDIPGPLGAWRRKQIADVVAQIATVLPEALP